MNWFLHFIGANNLSGPAYGFWSGFGSDIGELAIVGGLIGMIRKTAQHHRERIAQSARQHRELVEQAKLHHEESKAHVAQHLAAHCADLKEHLEAVARAKPGGRRM